MIKVKDGKLAFGNYLFITFLFSENYVLNRTSEGDNGSRSIYLNDVGAKYVQIQTHNITGEHEKCIYENHQAHALYIAKLILSPKINVIIQRLIHDDIGLDVTIDTRHVYRLQILVFVPCALRSTFFGTFIPF